MLEEEGWEIPTLKRTEEFSTVCFIEVNSTPTMGREKKWNFERANAMLNLLMTVIRNNMKKDKLTLEWPFINASHYIDFS